MLTEAKYKYSPEYLEDFSRRFGGLSYGAEYYVLKSKVPGQTLHSYRTNHATMYEVHKDVIKNPFEVAIR